MPAVAKRRQRSVVSIGCLRLNHHSVVLGRALQNLQFTAVCSTVAVNLLNPAGMGAQSLRSRCAISRGILNNPFFWLPPTLTALYSDIRTILIKICPCRTAKKIADETMLLHPRFSCIDYFTSRANYARPRSFPAISAIVNAMTVFSRKIIRTWVNLNLSSDLIRITPDSLMQISCIVPRTQRMNFES